MMINNVNSFQLLCKFVTSSPIEEEWTLNVFLPRFTVLCQDSIFHVRKVCLFDQYL